MTEAPWEADPTLDDLQAAAAASTELEPDDRPGEDDDPTPIVALIARGSARAAASWHNPDDVARYADELRATVLGNVRSLAQVARERRKLEDGRTTSSAVAPELRLMGDAHDALVAVSDAIRAGAEETRAIAGEIVLDVDPDAELKTATVRVGDGRGGDLKVTRSQATRVRTDEDAIVDVLVANLVEGNPDNATPVAVAAYARGAREAIAQLRALVGPLAWKSTALDGLAKTLEDREEYDLAIRLGHAYGRVSHGSPKTKLERVERSKR